MDYDKIYFGDRIVSLAFSHPRLSEIVQFKNSKKQKSEAYILEEKQKQHFIKLIH